MPELTKKQLQEALEAEAKGRAEADIMAEEYRTRSERQTRVYAWSHDTNDPANPTRHVTVLHSHPIRTAQDAVRAAIVQEFRSLGTEES